MKKDDKKEAARAAQMLINANLSDLGRESSERIAAHLQYVDGYYIDYQNEMKRAVSEMPLETALAELLGEKWTKMSRTQQRQWLTKVGWEMAATLEFIHRFGGALSAQATMIEQSESLRVEALTAKLAKDEPYNQDQDEHSPDAPGPSEGHAQEHSAIGSGAAAVQ
ncbi:hypothetical protein [Fibrella aestuarina]|uniref:hypothetical protein n=1 Tax=Fibrella aestuarina TaxID=651143 RepID=UPI000314DE1D|nr:hypothetical protein [Fibrella aestuarina]